MSQVGEFFYVVEVNLYLRSNNSIFEDQKIYVVWI